MAIKKSSYKATRLSYISIFLFILFILGITGASLLALKTNTDGRSKAAYEQAICTGAFTNQVTVSANGANFFESITIPQSVTRYYVNTGSKCVTSLDVLIQGRVIENWGTKPWGTYLTNKDGIARIDFNTIGVGKYTAQVKPHGMDVAWSNPFIVEVIPTPNPDTSTQQVNFLDYWPDKPGYSYLYDSYNTFTNTKTQGRIVLEELTDWCGNKVIPWQFVKDHPDAYWGQTLPGMAEGTKVIRWMMADPNSSINGVNYNNWVSYIGHKLYPISGIRGIEPTDGMFIPRQYQTYDANIPAYGVGKKIINVPSKEYIEKATYNVITDAQTCPVIYKPGVALPSLHNGWNLRYEFENISIPAANPGEFAYSGPALRIDFYEYYTEASNLMGDRNSNPFFRETWYLVKNIGPVRVIGTTYNGYGELPICEDEYVTKDGKGCSKECSKDADCFADTIQKPTYHMELKKFFRNPKIAVSVAGKINENPGSTTTIAQGEPYYLNVQVIIDDNNPVAYPYTGYLESKLTNGRPTKWLWVEDGVAYVAPSITQTIGAGTYTAAFRVWVPDGNFPNERKIGDTDIPWSNQITVTVTPPNAAAAVNGKSQTRTVQPTPTPGLKARILNIQRRSSSSRNGATVQ